MAIGWLKRGNSSNEGVDTRKQGEEYGREGEGEKNKDNRMGEKGRTIYFESGSEK